MRTMEDYVVTYPAVAPAVTSGALTGIAVDATGYTRARFVFHFGANTSTAALSAGGGVWNASTSGATYTSMSTAVLAAVSSGVLGSTIMVVDTAVTAAKPWLKISGATITLATVGVSATCTLYNGLIRPPTQSEQQIVVV